jgi:rhodanese-related sulfurtransferase
MTMPENMGHDGHDPDRAGALRGALLIVVVGTALGIGYNAMGLASRPRHGLAWIKQPEKIESLEALQGAPASGAPEASTSAPGPGDAVAATMETSAATTSGSASGSGTASTKHDSTSARHDSTSAAKSKSKTKPAPSKPADKSAQASKGASPPATTPAASASAGSTPAPAASAPAAGTAATNLPTIPDVTGPLKVELATFKKLYDAGAALVIDAREAEEYTDGHIAGAMTLPYNDAMAEPDKVKKLDPAGKPIVVYCSGGDCELSMDLAKLLVENGKRKVLVYEGGFPEWSGAGYAVTKGANP